MTENYKKTKQLGFLTIFLFSLGAIFSFVDILRDVGFILGLWGIIMGVITASYSREKL